MNPSKVSSRCHRSARISATVLFLVALTLAVHGQNRRRVTPTNAVVTHQFSWMPPHTNHFVLTNLWVTIAGSAEEPGSADGSGADARFSQPMGIAIDEADNVYIADTANQTIRRMSPNGRKWIVTTIAGRPGLRGSADGTNGAARFNEPAGIALGKAGALFVVDSLNHTIRKIARSGTNWVVTTIAGLAGTNGFRDGTNHIARFNGPLGIAADRSDTLYVADTLNQTIREIKPIGTNWVVKTIAGSPLHPGKTDGVWLAAQFNQPTGVASDTSGNVYVADSMNSTIRQLRPFGSNWMTRTIAGFALLSGSTDGANFWARFAAPSGISIDNSNNLYVTDFGNHTIRKISPVGTNWIVSTWGGSAGASGTNEASGIYARFNSPRAIAVSTTGTNYYVADTLNQTIREGGRSGVLTNITLGGWVQTGIGIRAGGPVPAH